MPAGDSLPPTPRLDEDAIYEGPRRLAWHCGGFHVQTLHVRPRVFRGGNGKVRIVCTSDHSGHGNVFLAEIPPYEALPEAPRGG